MILEAFFDLQTLAKAFPDEYTPIQLGVSILDDETSTKDATSGANTDSPCMCRCHHGKSAARLSQKL